MSQRKVTVTYLGHSGFMMETESAVFVADYVNEEPEAGFFGFDGGAVSGEALAQLGKPVFVLVSHSHSDHFNPAVFGWAAQVKDITYILGAGVPARGGVVLEPGQRVRVGQVCVTAYGSTDEGVSFLIESDGLSLFHAGDLNLWHWREESTPEEILQAEADFRQVMATLEGREVDVAFFPTDPRMGPLYYTGALSYIETVKPAVFFPMHFWQDATIPAHFARLAKCRHTQVMLPERRGQRFELELPAWEK